MTDTNSQAVRATCKAAKNMRSQIEETVACLAVQQLLFETSGDSETAEFIKLTANTLEQVQSHLQCLANGVLKLEKALIATQEVVESKQNLIEIMKARIAELTDLEAVR